VQYQIDEKIDCAFSPINGIGFFSPFNANQFKANAAQKSSVKRRESHPIIKNS
jgi:hypothetical protein